MTRETAVIKRVEPFSNDQIVEQEKRTRGRRG